MLNNEILHFMFTYKYSTYQVFMDTCNEKQYEHNISTNEETRNIIRNCSSRKVYSSIFDYLIDYM